MNFLPFNIIAAIISTYISNTAAAAASVNVFVILWPLLNWR